MVPIQNILVEWLPVVDQLEFDVRRDADNIDFVDDDWMLWKSWRELGHDEDLSFFHSDA